MQTLYVLVAFNYAAFVVQIRNLEVWKKVWNSQKKMWNCRYKEVFQLKSMQNLYILVAFDQ